MKKYISIFLTCVLTVCLLTGCGGQSAKSEAAYDSGAYNSAAGAAPESPMMGSTMLSEEKGSVDAQLPENRKWIITVNLRAETENLDVLTASLNEKIAALGGYVENQSVYNGSAYSGGYRYRSAELTVRIPAERVDEFTDHIAGISNVVRKQKTLEDITLQYVDTQSRMEALETEKARLQELLDEAKNMSDLLEIEARLTDVLYELESVTSRLRLYDNQVEYATIHLSLEEVREYTPVDEPTLWERIRDGFTGSLEGLWESLKYLLVFLVSAFPFVVVYGLIAWPILVLIRRLRRKRKAKKAAKKEET